MSDAGGQFGPTLHGSLIIIPALNEEASIGAVLDDLRMHAPQSDVLVVDDGSTDATGQVALRRGAAVATLPFNMGIGAALRTGFRYAERCGYERAAQFDADGQHAASELAQLFEALDDGADLVIGSRFAKADGSYEVGQTRGLAMGILRVALRWMTGMRLTDTSSGFRGFSRRAIITYADRYPREYLDSVEALVLATHVGLEIREVPVQMHERQGGDASTRSLKLAFHYLRLLTVLATQVSFVRHPHRAGSTS
jgi:glycosyltransferase involved in cell wall biosynthesis